MTMTKDLFLSLLAMDSYNRGHEAGMNDLGPVGSMIGAATFIEQSSLNLQSPQIEAGFYASVYQLDTAVGDMPAGTIIISYRGTDNFQELGGDSDITNGWVTGLGIVGNQAHLAAKFYAEIREANPGANIILTGHSLGGGLAGFVAKLNGLEAVMFDNMPFELAA